jgi:hypothetical protein
VDSFHEAPPFALLIVSAQHGWHLSHRDLEQCLKKLASRVDAEFYCLLSLNARQASTQLKKSPAVTA